MTVRVAEVLPNGDLVLEGVREIDINGDRQMVVLTGVVRPADVMPANVDASSTQIGQLSIRYFGRGLDQGQPEARLADPGPQQGLLTRSAVVVLRILRSSTVALLVRRAAGAAGPTSVGPRSRTSPGWKAFGRCRSSATAWSSA